MESSTKKIKVTVKLPWAGPHEASGEFLTDAYDKDTVCELAYDMAENLLFDLVSWDWEVVDEAE